MIRRIAHVCLVVRDLGRTTEFYRDLLGFPVQFNTHRNGTVIGAHFRVCEGNFVEAFESKGNVAKNTGIIHFCFEVDDMGRTLECLRSRGVQVTDQKLGWDKTWEAWLEDPDGNRIELHQYTEDSSQANGKPVVVP